MIVLEYILLVGVIVCAIAAPLCKRLLAAVMIEQVVALLAPTEDPLCQRVKIDGTV